MFNKNIGASLSQERGREKEKRTRGKHSQERQTERQTERHRLLYNKYR